MTKECRVVPAQAGTHILRPCDADGISRAGQQSDQQ